MLYLSFATRVTQFKMHYFSGVAFESLISSQLLKKEKYIWSYQFPNSAWREFLSTYTEISVLFFNDAGN